MSKVYALSGARATYLCAITPPWAVSLPAQVAAVAALQNTDYYAQRWTETHELRKQLASQLAEFNGWEIIPGIANFILCLLPEDGPTAAEIVSRCRDRGLFLRDVGSMGQTLGSRALRIAVKDAETNARMVEILGRVGESRTRFAEERSLQPASMCEAVKSLREFATLGVEAP